MNKLMTDVFRPYRDRINEQLGQHLRCDTTPARLQQAMQYGVFNGGKRIRPLLVYLATEALQCPLEMADKTACALELIHAYSLIHDDLPAMDDDDLRRGNPTVHIKFDEATAILAGDALQALAFELIAGDKQLDAETRISLIELLAKASGGKGMVAGQIIDLEAETKTIDASQLENMHRRKTGDLISASIMAGAIIAGADDDTRQCLTTFGYTLGLAFQVKDDILDEVGDTEVMGKRQGADQNRNKTTFISTHGLNAAIAYLDDLHQQARQSLTPMGQNASLLLALNDFVVNRDH